MPTLRRQSRQPASTSGDGALAVLSGARSLPSRSALAKWAQGARKKDDAAAAAEDKENRRTAQQPEPPVLAPAARRPGRGRDKLSVPRACAQDLLPRSAHSVRDSLSELLRASSRQGLGDSGSGGVTEELPAVRTGDNFGWAWEDNPLGREGKWRRVSFTSRRLSFDAPLARLSLSSSCSEADAPGGLDEKGSVWPGRFSLGSSSPRRVGKLVSLVKCGGVAGELACARAALPQSRAPAAVCEPRQRELCCKRPLCTPALSSQRHPPPRPRGGPNTAQCVWPASKRNLIQPKLDLY